MKLVKHPDYDSNLLNLVEDKKMPLNQNIKKNEELNDFKNFNNINIPKKEDSKDIYFDKIIQIRYNNDNNISFDIKKEFREDNGIVSIKRYIYNKFMKEINSKIINSEWKLNQFIDEKVKNISKEEKYQII